MFKKIFLVLALSATIFSCKVAFVPKSSAEMIANVMQVQSDLNSLYTGYIASADKRFDAAKYDPVGGEIDALVQAEAARDHGKNMTRQATLLHNYFDKYKTDHQVKGVLNAHELIIYKDYLQSLVKPILVSELTLK